MTDVPHLVHWIEPGLDLVFDCPRGFVTDLGVQVAVRSEAGVVVALLPRYGVWKLDRAKGTHQVSLTTNDLAEATREAER
jgi:hypothetical protein